MLNSALNNVWSANLIFLIFFAEETKDELGYNF